MDYLYDKLKQYNDTDIYPYHMPGHKRNEAGRLPGEWISCDITEIAGFDNLHYAEGILKDLQDEAAALYGAEESFYLVNGSTAGILSAVSAALPEKGHLLMPRNCHKSVYHAAYLRHLSISYLYPDIMEEYAICEAVTPGQVELALEEEPDIRGVLVVSPTYEGRIADVAGIARVTHQRGIPLIVDEAHGAHLGFHGGFAQNSCRLGADYVIHSVHKTLPAMTQTALLHVSGKLADKERVKRFLRIYQSSSPSYVLMASIDNALGILREQGSELFEIFLNRWNAMLQELAECKHLQILADQTGHQDPGKMIISIKKNKLSGLQLYDMLLQEYHLQLEMASDTCVLAMFTISDREEGFLRMTQALKEIDLRCGEYGRMEDSGKGNDPVVSIWGEVMSLRRADTPEAIPLSQAWDLEVEMLLLKLCTGRYAGDFISLYPPGVPLLVPGEVITGRKLKLIMGSLKNRLSVTGVIHGEDGYRIPVIKMDSRSK